MLTTITVTYLAIAGLFYLGIALTAPRSEEVDSPKRSKPARAA